ncbi:MAG TPA: hypothetical protein VL096_15205 [Pirellulaceae bacterium]|nr:hypothetical protein [Pirellulaceae bacterium]
MKPRQRNWLLLALLLLTGCGQAKIQPDNLRLTASLRTALSAKNPQWLDQNIQAIEERRAAGEMGDEEYAAFKRIVAQAQGGDWDGAERATVTLQKAQRPTPEQLEKLPTAK